jgi:hypothetical protein
VPLRNKEGSTVCDALYKRWYCAFGVPYELQSDQGQEFTNDLLARINLRLAVGHRVTTPYYPQANGEAERFNRTLKNMIKIYADQHPASWGEYLDGLIFAYKTSLNPVLGFTPFYLWFGREARLPTDVLLGAVKDIKHDVEQYRTNLTLHLRQAYEIVKKNLEEYAVNDAAHSHQFKSSWQGPFNIVSQKYSGNEDVYMLKDDKTGREWTVNVHKLKRFNKRPFLNTLDTPDPLGEREAPLHDSMRSDVNIPAVDRSRDIEMGAYTVSADGVINHGAEGISTTDALDVIVSCPEDSKAKPTDPQGPSPSFRHLTGVTVQEQGRRDERERDIDQETNLEQLQEFELKSILRHKRSGRGGRLYYEVEWTSGHPNTWQLRETFNQTEIIQDYWDTQPKSQCPREFRRFSEQKSRPEREPKRQKTSKTVRLNMDL